MRLKDFPEVIVDEIPKLYEKNIKVLITHLYGLEEQVARLPKQFCKMYTTQPLADQLRHYLRSRDAAISANDFRIIKDTEPFTLRLSDGKRLEVMLCAGNELGSSLMLLIRKLQAGRLLCYYSAVQQDDLWRLMGNVTYQEWIAKGTEVLLLNLKAVDQPFNHVDFEEVATDIVKYADTVDGKTELQVPLLGYEYLIRRLAQTLTLYGHMKLKGAYLDSYRCLSSELRYFEQTDYKINVHVVASKSAECDFRGNPYPLKNLKWSPVPNRMNLIQLCSLLRPLHINGIVAFHATGNVPPVPQYLKRFRLQNSPNPKAMLTEREVNMPATQLLQRPREENPPQTKIHPKQTNSRKNPIVFVKQRKLHFVEYEDDD